MLAPDRIISDNWHPRNKGSKYKFTKQHPIFSSTLCESHPSLNINFMKIFLKVSDQTIPHEVINHTYQGPSTELCHLLNPMVTMKEHLIHGWAHLVLSSTCHTEKSLILCGQANRSHTTYTLISHTSLLTRVPTSQQ